ncbi:MAG: OmpH family outer membrane protein [Acidobacteria bacterium]|nr:OmpH family outer membrane protein [Acidobacteriota bacterium]
MKYKVNFLLAPTLLLLLAMTAFPQTPTPKAGQSTPAASSASADLPKPKVAFVNTAAFREYIDELKPLYEKLGTELTPREQELSSIKTSIDAKQEQVDKNSAKMTPAQIRKLQDDIEQLRKEGQRKLEDYQEFAQKREGELTGPTYTKIMEHLNKYVAEKGITIVFSTLQVAEANMIVYMDPKADVTQDFITSYNKANPAAAAAAKPKS